jgi:hypothetical protein
VVHRVQRLVAATVPQQVEEDDPVAASREPRGDLAVDPRRQQQAVDQDERVT